MQHAAVSETLFVNCLQWLKVFSVYYVVAVIMPVDVHCV